MPKESKLPLSDLSKRQDNIYTKYNNYTTQKPNSISLSVVQSGEKMKGEPNHISGPAIYDHYIIHYVTKGKGTYTNGIQQYDIEAGDAFLILPYQTVTYQADGEDPWNYYWVGFTGADAYQLVTRCGMDETHLKFTYRQDKRLEKTLAELAHIRLVSPSKEYMLIGLLYQFVSIAMEVAESHTSKPADEYYYQTVQYIRSHLCDSALTVDEIAHALGLHRCYLYRIFRERAQMSIQNYISQLRLEKAKALLIHSNSSISQIAQNCGFANSSYFSSAYKKYFGHTPLWERQQTAGEGESFHEK